MTIGRYRVYSVLQSIPVTLWLAVAVFTAITGNNGVSAKEAVSIESVSRIADGTRIENLKIDGWSHLVLLATPQPSSGDVERLSRTVKRYASMFSTVIAANVVKSGKIHRLNRIGIGLAMEDGDGFRIASQRAETPTHGLGMISSRVLGSIEESFDRLKLTASRPGFVVIDSPAVIQIDGKHHEQVARHLIWVHPTSGNLASAVWFIKTGDAPKVIDHQGVILPASFHESRRLHVDANEIFFGIPSDKTFALEALPPGESFPFKPALAKSASQSQLPESTLAEIFKVLNERTHGSPGL